MDEKAYFRRSSKFASRPGVKRVAVENLLMSMGENEEEARSNLILDSFLYSWNAATIKAVRDGIEYACVKEEKPTGHGLSSNLIKER